MQLLAAAAREIALVVGRWLKAKVVDYVFDNVEDWVHDGVGWVVRKLTGATKEEWEKRGRDLAEASIDIDTLGGGSKDLFSRIWGMLLTPEGMRWMEKWRDKLEDLTGLKAEQMRLHIEVMPIPRDESITAWAVRLAKRFGLQPHDVIQRRENLV